VTGGQARSSTASCKHRSQLRDFPPEHHRVGHFLSCHLVIGRGFFPWRGREIAPGGGSRRGQTTRSNSIFQGSWLIDRFLRWSPPPPSAWQKNPLPVRRAVPNHRGHVPARRPRDARPCGRVAACPDVNPLAPGRLRALRRCGALTLPRASFGDPAGKGWPLHEGHDPGHRR
jgi:hypothetical protein